MDQNVLIGIVLALILLGAVWYLVRASRKGRKCIGCAHADTCARRCVKGGACVEHKNPEEGSEKE